MLSSHLHGMLVAFVVAAVLVAYFVVQLSAAIEARDREIAAFRDLAMRNERLASLTTLAAGAAHELGTPLGTIAVASKELERALTRLPETQAASFLEDARLIRSEVDRCRSILDRLSSDAGDLRGEAPESVPIRTVVDDALANLSADQSARVRVELSAQESTATVPRFALATAIASLLRNALDATPANVPVRLLVASANGRLSMTVRDPKCSRALSSRFSRPRSRDAAWDSDCFSRARWQSASAGVSNSSLNRARASLRRSSCLCMASTGRLVVADQARSILIVDDDDVYRARLARAFRDAGWDVRDAADARSAVAALELSPPETAVVDLRLPDGSGLDVVRRLKQLHPAAVVVVLTGYGSIATALDALRMGAVHYLTKPADMDDILAGFARADLPLDGAPDVMAGDEREAPSLARVEWEHIQRVLADSDGNVSEAARRLGLHRRSLQRKLLKYPVRQ
jgi:two-component system response regulator RegA